MLVSSPGLVHSVCDGLPCLVLIQYLVHPAPVQAGAATDVDAPEPGGILRQERLGMFPWPRCDVETELVACFDGVNEAVGRRARCGMDAAISPSSLTPHLCRGLQAESDFPTVTVKQFRPRSRSWRPTRRIRTWGGFASNRRVWSVTRRSPLPCRRRCGWRVDDPGDDERNRFCRNSHAFRRAGIRRQMTLGPIEPRSALYGRTEL